MDTEAMARAAFVALHALHHRPRQWDTHPDGDNGAELGRDTFRAMAAAMGDAALAGAVATLEAFADRQQTAQQAAQAALKNAKAAPGAYAQQPLAEAQAVKADEFTDEPPAKSGKFRDKGNRPTPQSEALDAAWAAHKRANDTAPTDPAA